jgi:cytochrome b6-f complex iron-sulfur subunit
LQEPTITLVNYHTVNPTNPTQEKQKRKMKLLSIVTSLLAAGSAVAFAPAKMAGTNSRSLVSTNMAAAEELYIDEERRFLMNLILLGSGALTVGAIGVPYILFFVPPGAGGGSGGSPAKDALGNDLFAQAYLSEKPAGDRSLAQGLKGDATYLIVKDDKTLESYGLNAGTFLNTPACS